MPDFIPFADISLNSETKFCQLCVLRALSPTQAYSSDKSLGTRYLQVCLNSLSSSTIESCKEATVFATATLYYYGLCHVG